MVVLRNRVCEREGPEYDLPGLCVGQAAWREVERLHPEVRAWELVTTYFETRNIHFYVNKLDFHIVEFFCDHHPDPNETDNHEGDSGDDDTDGMFRFEKVIRP